MIKHHCIYPIGPNDYHSETLEKISKKQFQNFKTIKPNSRLDPTKSDLYTCKRCKNKFLNITPFQQQQQQVKSPKDVIFDSPDALNPEQKNTVKV